MEQIQTHWIEIDPLDTLFFRGTESMVAGENHEADTMFPPMPATLTGAIRTALLGQKKLAPTDYLKNPEKWSDQYPLLGLPEKPGFTVIGPLFRIGKTTIYPVPAHWMAEMDDNAVDGDSVRLQAGQPVTNQGLGLVGSVSNPFWISKPVSSEMKSLTGYWVTAHAFKEMASGSGTLTLRKKYADLKEKEATLIAIHDLFQREERVGIALTRQRTAKEGHLYASVHVRIQPEVRLLVGLQSSHAFSLDRKGILQLGGEQRMCAYMLANAPKLPVKSNGKLLFALSPIPAELPETVRNQPRSSGNLLRIGGWDMKKKFHKPLCAWLPAGTVILNNETGAAVPACIAI